MWLKVAIAVAILLWLMRSKAEAAPPPPASMVPPPGPIEGGYTGGTIDTGPATVTFHEGSGVWDTPWIKPAGGDSACTVEPDEFGGMRYVCP